MSPPTPSHPFRQAALVAGVLVLSVLAARAIRGRFEARPKVERPEVAASEHGPGVRGKLLFQVHCARCHGPEGHGDGPDSSHLQPGPRDFSGEGWKFGPDPASIRKAIVEGVPGSAMYASGSSFTSRELDALVEQVGSLASKGKAEARRAEIRSLLKAAGFSIEGVRLAPSLSVEDLQGHPQSWSFGPGGTLTLLSFWGTSCAPCLEELPDLDRLAAEFGPRGLVVRPVCVDESDRSAVARVIAGRFDQGPSFINRDGMATARYDLQTLPVAALIDRDGTLLGIARGRIDWSSPEARAMIDRCLNER